MAALPRCPHPDGFRWELLASDTGSRARLGRLHTRRGVVDTPAFMPVGTRAAVKGLLPEQVRGSGAQILLANTFHLLLRPGPELIAARGGVSAWMGWHGPVLTDSGGFQVFSLGLPRREAPKPILPVSSDEDAQEDAEEFAAPPASLRRVDDDGVTFRSPVDGQIVRMTPERAMAVQNALGSDIAMAFDECPPYGCPRAELLRAVDRTVAWAGRCVRHQSLAPAAAGQALFGIVQGGLDPALRRSCAAALKEMDFPGYALGGLSVGESREEMVELLDSCVGELPSDRPRYLMGVGTPRDLIDAVALGVDMFDCVMPTRNGRNGCAFTSQGMVRLRNRQHRESVEPLDPNCGCTACQGFSRSYLRHLLVTDEMAGPILVSLHNLHYYQGLMKRLRVALGHGQFATVAYELRQTWT